MSAERTNDIENRFSFHPATAVTGPLHDATRAAYRTIAHFVSGQVPDGRHQALALTALQDQFRARDTGKIYLALVYGSWPARLKVIDEPLQKSLDAHGERRVPVARERLVARRAVHGDAAKRPHRVEIREKSAICRKLVITTPRMPRRRVRTTSSGSFTISAVKKTSIGPARPTIACIAPAQSSASAAVVVSWSVRMPAER